MNFITFAGALLVFTLVFVGSMGSWFIVQSALMLVFKEFSVNMDQYLFFWFFVGAWAPLPFLWFLFGPPTGLVRGWLAFAAGLFFGEVALRALGVF